MSGRSKIYETRNYGAIDIENPSLAAALRHIEGDSPQVLDVGCACGDFGVLAKSRGRKLRIVGVDIDAESIVEAEKTGAYERILKVDLERLACADLPDGFMGCFDYVVCCDVLEHLRNFRMVLGKLRACLKPCGKLIASIPNVAHMSVKANLLVNDFTYTPVGLLDETHVHLFTHKTIASEFADAGLKIAACHFTAKDRVGLQPENPFADLPYDVLRMIYCDWHSYVWQYVVKCEPSELPVPVLDFANQLNLRLDVDTAPPEIVEMRKLLVSSTTDGVADKLNETLGHLTDLVAGIGARLDARAEALRLELYGVGGKIVDAFAASGKTGAQKTERELSGESQKEQVG